MCLDLSTRLPTVSEELTSLLYSLVHYPELLTDDCVSMWCHMLMRVLFPVPEVPQDVGLSERAVKSMFVTWRPPPGQVDRYRVRHV